MSAEPVKLASRGLRGTVAPSLDDASPSFGADDVTVLKFHGIYQQDDRDTRKARTRAGDALDHSCMVRIGLPGGRLRSDQWLALDRVADVVGSESLRLTTRQGIQFHGIVKGHLRTLLRTIAARELSTFAACGDVVRNVMASPAPLPGAVAEEIHEVADRIATHFRPATRAYVEIWLDDEPALTVESTEHEPIYGTTYLPRKFKIGIASPGDNAVDVLTHDVGIVPVVADGRIERFTLAIGGGLGRSHQRPDTFPRLGSWFADVEPDELIEVLEAIVVFQRDHGDRSDRKQARLKYVVERLGVDEVRRRVEDLLGRRLGAPSHHEFPATDDHLGWHRAADGSWFLGIHVPSGRIRDDAGRDHRSAVRTLAQRFESDLRCTPQQNLLVCGIDAADRRAVEQVLHDHGVPLVEQLRPLERAALACPALPTCGQALGEAERAMPEILATLDGVLDDLGLTGEPIQLRVTGCPNGCARPYVAELALVGRTKTAYDLYLGGSHDGTRLNRAVRTSIRVGDLADELRPILRRWAAERRPGERLGDWANRVGPDSLGPGTAS
ncbi:MAG: NADPH-dependent assimilatory sulfite reductase hemoprotein subunit [Actinomycetota bacterium]